MLTLWIALGEVLLLVGFLIGQRFPHVNVREYLIHVGRAQKVRELIRNLCRDSWTCVHRAVGMCTIAELVRGEDVIVLPNVGMFPHGAMVLFQERLSHQPSVGELYLCGLEKLVSMQAGWSPRTVDDGVRDDDC